LVDIIVVDDLILNARLRGMCNSPDLMSVSQVRVMRSGYRVIPIIRIRSDTSMFGGSLKVTRRSAMCLSCRMVDKVLFFSIHQIPRLESGKWTVQRTAIVLKK
jgi:hypothetical protein